MGRRPVNFAYPVGSWDERVEGIVKEVFGTARLWSAFSEPVYNTRSTDRYRLEANNISAQVSFEHFRRIVDGSTGER